jgi:hypothetical protein
MYTNESCHKEYYQDSCTKRYKNTCTVINIFYFRSLIQNDSSADVRLPDNVSASDFCQYINCYKAKVLK